MTALHLKMPHQLYCCLSNPFEFQWKPAHPQPAPASLSSERRQCKRFNTGSFGVENGVFLIFCLVQFPYSEPGWQLECCYILHTSVRPSYSPPLHTLCFTVLWQKHKPFLHTCFSSEYTLKAGTHSYPRRHKLRASLKRGLMKSIQTHVCVSMHACAHICHAQWKTSKQNLQNALHWRDEN